MSSFRYTINQDYSESNKTIYFNGFYKSSNGAAALLTQGSPLAVSVEEMSSAPDYRSVLSEIRSKGSEYYILSDNNGVGLFWERTGFKLDYRDLTKDVRLSGGLLGDSIYAGSGNDFLVGNAGHDHLYGNAGNDVLEGGSGADALYGGKGLNTASYLTAFTGVTVNLSLNGAAQVSAGDANGDTLFNINNIYGGFGSDTLTGTTGANVLIGGAGDDTLRGMGGADVLDGGAGKDRLIITKGGASIDGGADADTLFLQGASAFSFTNDTLKNIEIVSVANGATLDLSSVTLGTKIVSQSNYVNNTDHLSVRITGTKGSDTIVAGQGDDTIYGNDGNDVLTAGSGYVHMFGGKGNDTLTGSSDFAYLYGEDGNDVIRAGSGFAVLDGGVGADKLVGGKDENIFIFNKGYGREDIYNFTTYDDYFEVSTIVDTFDEIHMTRINGSNDLLVTFEGLSPDDKLVVHDVGSLSPRDFGFIA